MLEFRLPTPDAEMKIFKSKSSNYNKTFWCSTTRYPALLKQSEY